MLLAFFAFIGVATTPSSASVIDNIDKTVQVVVDDDNTAVADIEKDKKKKKSAKVTKSTAKSGECCGSVKSGCGEASKGCGSSCDEKAEGKKEVKKKTLE